MNESPTAEATIETLGGAAIAPVTPEVARLRIDVFREFPYLYDGSEDHERKYVGKYVDEPRSTVVIARVGGVIVGASTAIPMLKAGEDVIKPFRAAGVDPARVYYFGESVLRKEWRGHGIGVSFFRAREARARELGFPIVTFCAVDRSSRHPRRPPDYVPLDAFWTHRGYTRRSELVCHFTWKEIDEARASPKTLTFWVKNLDQTATDIA